MPLSLNFLDLLLQRVSGMNVCHVLVVTEGSLYANRCNQEPASVPTSLLEAIHSK